jgi:HAD superfamily hydrolase (TIGR01490 family)
MTASKSIAALFDMDRTLLRRETGSLWMKYQRDIGEASLFDMARVTYWVAQYRLGIAKVEEIAERVTRTLEGRSEAQFIAQCEDWFDRYVEKHISDEGRRAVEDHRKKDHVIAIVTGATPYAARPLARRLGIEHVIASELEVDDRTKCFTGRPRKPLCYGHGKVSLSTVLGEKLGFALDEATFYTDSVTDLPLLERVKVPVVINPDPRLRRVARRRGWRVETW